MLVFGLVVDAAHITATTRAMLAAHPYETPTYQIIPLHLLESLENDIKQTS